MKRRELVRLLEKNGWWHLRNGSKHDIYTNGTEQESVSRQTELKDHLCKSIIKRRGLK